MSGSRIRFIKRNIEKLRNLDSFIRWAELQWSKNIRPGKSASDYEVNTSDIFIYDSLKKWWNQLPKKNYLTNS